MTTKYDNSNAADWGLSTRAIHAGFAPDAQTSACLLYTSDAADE